MDIPGIASYKNQPTVTNPLDSESSVVGQQTFKIKESEVDKTVSFNEQNSLELSTSAVVNQTRETIGTTLNNGKLGNYIDIFV